MRSDILDWIATSGYHWAGFLDEDAFLSRLYDLQSMPTTDTRVSQYPTAAEDIWQHRVNNLDWDDDWIFTDRRFNLRHSKDGTFLAFLLETVHPAVRRDSTAAASMVRVYNEVIATAGYRIIEDRRIGEVVHFKLAETTATHTPDSVRVQPQGVTSSVALAAQLRRLRRDIDSDPAASIAHCKDLLESQCKLVLTGFGMDYSERDDLPALYGAASRALGVHASDIPENSRASGAVRNMLRNLQSIVQNVAEARNSLGTGHGRAEDSYAQMRHAHLVFNATVAIAEFIAETWEARTSPSVDG
ncbi:hypothetical protein BFL35_09040 [Clavibacter michiganensis]|nr:hypothetical protein BFL35_09040 [Clavibacter michiganensis]